MAATSLTRPQRRAPGFRAGGTWVWAIGATTAFLLAGAVYVYMAVALPGGPEGMSDLHVYVGAVRAALGGGSLYDYASFNGDGFLYPPFAALALAPLTLLPETALRVLWTLGQLAEVAVLAWAVVRRAEQPVLRRHSTTATVPVVACLLLLAQPVFTGLFLGQVSLLVTLLALLDALDLTPPRLRGVATGLAAAVKLTPLAFLPYLWLTGRRRAAVAGASTFAAATALAAVVWPDAAVRHWSTLLTTPPFVDVAQADNQSLAGLFARQGWTGGWARVLLAGLVALVALAAYRRSRRLHAEGRVLAGALVVGALVVLVSPLSWSHHQTTLTLVAACCVAEASRRGVNLAWLGGVLVLTSFPVQLVLGTYRPAPALLSTNVVLLLALAVVVAVPLSAPGPGGRPSRRSSGGRPGSG